MPIGLPPGGRPIKTWGVGLRGLAMLKRGRIFLLRVPPLILI